MLASLLFPTPTPHRATPLSFSSSLQITLDGDTFSVCITFTLWTLFRAKACSQLCLLFLSSPFLGLFFLKLIIIIFMCAYFPQTHHWPTSPLASYLSLLSLSSSLGLCLTGCVSAFSLHGCTPPRSPPPPLSLLLPKFHVLPAVTPSSFW